VGNQGGFRQGRRGIPSGGRGRIPSREGDIPSEGRLEGFRRGRRGILLGGGGDSVVKGGVYCRERKWIPTEKKGDSVGKGRGFRRERKREEGGILLKGERDSVVGEGGIQWREEGDSVGGRRWITSGEVGLRRVWGDSVGVGVEFRQDRRGNPSPSWGKGDSIQGGGGEPSGEDGDPLWGV
jgi:hypothetical protein